MADVRSQSVLVDGQRLHFLEWGPPSAPPVVILHGFAGHAWQAELPARVLSADFRVVALDQRGHGDSDPAAVYGSVPMTHDLLGFLDVVGVTRTALVGHSMGGLVAMCAVAREPERFTALVLGDVGPEPAREGTERILRNVAQRDVFTDVDDAYATQMALNPTADPAAMRHRVEHNLRPRADGALTWKYDVAFRDGSARYENHAPDELWAFLAAIPIPILLLRGERSDILSTDIAARMLATNARASLVTLPGSGHSVATDVPDLVTAALVDFLPRP